MSATAFSQQWTRLLPAGEHLNADLLMTLTEDALNEYLRTHHAKDRDKYRTLIERSFEVDSGPRKFSLIIDGTSPIRLELPPFGTSRTKTSKARRIDQLFKSTRGWIRCDYPRAGSTPMADTDPPEPNIRIHCQGISFTLRWPFLDGSGFWRFETTVTAVAEGHVELAADDNHQWLRVVPTSIKLDAPDFRTLSRQIPIKAAGAKRGRDDQDYLQALRDLFIIALNIVANQYAPNLVASIELPAFAMGQKPLNVALVDLSNHMLTMALSLDRAALRTQNNQTVDERYSMFLAAVERDVERAGGLDKLLCKKTRVGKQVKLEPKTRAEVRRAMRAVNAFMLEQERKAKRLWNRPTTRRRRRASVQGGLGAAVNEYLLDALIADAMPTPVDRCTDWEGVLDVVRGRVCWWVQIFNPDASIQGTNVTGSVNVDVGGRIEACIKKFWDCSWRWECGSLLSLAVVGRPGIELELVHGKGVAFRAKVVGQLRLSTNLPEPFKSIVEFFVNLLIRAVQVIVNAVASAMIFDIVLPVLEFPDQNTKLELAPFSPFAYSRLPSHELLESRRNFVGFSVGVTGA